MRIQLKSSSSLLFVAVRWLVLLLYGGVGMPGAANLVQNADLVRMLKAQKDRKEWFGAVCASPAVVLKPLGLFPQSGTSYPAFHEKIAGAKNIEGKCLQLS